MDMSLHIFQNHQLNLSFLLSKVHQSFPTRELLLATATAKKAMEYERFSNCLTNARLKIRYVFGQNFKDLVYVDKRQSTNFVRARKYLVPGVNHG